MIEPFELDDDEPQGSCIVIEVKEIDDIYVYEFNLILENKEHVTVGEMRALRAGLKEALLRMNVILDKLGIEDENEGNT